MVGDVVFFGDVGVGPDVVEDVNDDDDGNVGETEDLGTAVAARPP